MLSSDLINSKPTITHVQYLQIDLEDFVTLKNLTLDFHIIRILNAIFKMIKLITK